METQTIGELIKSKLLSSTVEINEINWQARALKAEARVEALELVVLYAKDVIAMWPKFTLRSFDNMTSIINTMQQAINRAAQ